MLKEDTVREILARVSPAVDWTPVASGDSLEDAGLDSLDKASFFLEIETETGKKISDSDYEQLDTIESLLAFVNGGS